MPQAHLTAAKMDRAEFSTTIIPTERNGGTFTLRPDPIMELEAVVGFRGTYANTLLWSTGGQVCTYFQVTLSSS